MKELIDKFLMWFCFAGIGTIAAFTFVSVTLNKWKMKNVKCKIRKFILHSPFYILHFLIPILCVAGMILYGSTKNNSPTNDPPAQTQMVLQPSLCGELQVEKIVADAPDARPLQSAGVATTHSLELNDAQPTNSLVRVEKWWRRGAYNDGQVLTFDEDWRFPYGTNHLASIEVWASGAVYPSMKNPTPIASLVTKLSLAPHDTEVFMGRTTNNTYRIEWHDGHPNRDASQTADASIELFRNGNVVVTENGVDIEFPYDIPFEHDGFGQDEDWVRANFTNAEEIISIGYANWVDQQVGVGLTNGLYKFSALFEDDPPEPTELYIGDYSVCVTNEGEYVFVLEKGEEYEFGTWPFNDDVDYWAQDDLAADAPMLTTWWGGWESPGEWTVDGGEHWLDYPGMPEWGYRPGWCCWLPTLQGSPNVGHLGVTSFPQSFEAILSDYCGSYTPSYQWSSSDPSMTFSTPNAPTTTVTCASIPSWNMCSMSVQANLGGLSLWSYLYPTYGTNTTPQVHLKLDAPEGLALNGERRLLTANFKSDINTNGCVVVRCINGADKISLWSALTNGVSVASSNSWTVASTNAFSCYVQGTALSDYQGVEFECTYVPESGSNQVVRAKSTVFECYTQPVSNTPRTGLEVINPSFLNPQSNAVFRVEVKPVGIPSSKINWRAANCSAAFPSGTNGTETVVLGSSGMVDLEVKVLGATDERMHFKANVQQ